MTTHNDDGTELVAYEFAQRLILTTELHHLEQLLDAGYLNDDGVRYGYAWLIHPDQGAAATGEMQRVRERALAKFATALPEPTQ